MPQGYFALPFVVLVVEWFQLFQVAMLFDGVVLVSPRILGPFHWGFDPFHAVLLPYKTGRLQQVVAPKLVLSVDVAALVLVHIFSVDLSVAVVVVACDLLTLCFF